MGSLVTHVCSGVSGEVDVALELLCELVSQKPTEMAQYAVFVKVGVTTTHTASLEPKSWYALVLVV